MSMWPAMVITSPKLNRYTPSFSQVWDYDRLTPTSAVGHTLRSIQGAVGEYFERRHFFNEIVATDERTLHEMMPPQAAKSFTNAFIQTSSLSYEVIYKHKFKAVKAFNLFTLDPLEIPAVVVALDNVTASDDLEIYPDRDTCGCCFHGNLKDAIDGALCEFMERQSLLLYWLQGVGKVDISSRIVTGIGYIDEILDMLRLKGEVRIFDITLPDAPGYAILTIYGSSDDDSLIKYSAGLSYSYSLKDALCKSLVELWQSYICMHNFLLTGYSDERIIDSYQRHFLKCNKYDFFTDLCDKTIFTDHNIIHTIALQVSKNDILDYLKKVSDNIFVYYARERVNDGLVWYVKILSPDFFLHMNNSGAINLNNNIYNTGRGIKERESLMVPFP